MGARRGGPPSWSSWAADTRTRCLRSKSGLKIGDQGVSVCRLHRRSTFSAAARSDFTHGVHERQRSETLAGAALARGARSGVRRPKPVRCHDAFRRTEYHLHAERRSRHRRGLLRGASRHSGWRKAIMPRSPKARVAARGLDATSASNTLSCLLEMLHSKQLKSIKMLVDSNHGIYRDPLHSPSAGQRSRRERPFIGPNSVGRITLMSLAAG
jgi:hypothetical protein